MARSKSFQNTVGFVGLLVFLVSGCTRPEADSSRLSVNVPSAQALKEVGAASEDLQLKHLVINISGPGMNRPGYFVWSGCGDCTVPVTTPGELALDVPTGASRLVQVLAVYNVGSAGGTAFYYGDVTVDLRAAQESVKVPLDLASPAQDLASGQISGRILDSEDSGPTGAVNILYQPPGAKPPLVIEKSHMISGWFSFFALRGIQLRYEMEDGRKLFDGQSVDFSSSIFTPSKHLAKLYVPVRSYINGAGAIINSNEAEISVFGFFGDSSLLSTKMICHDVTASESSPFLAYGGQSGQMSFLVSSSVTSEPSDLFNRTGTAKVTLLGGQSASSTPCTASASAGGIYRNHLNLLKKNMGQGKERLPGYMIPFASLLSSASTLEYGNDEPLRTSFVDSKVKVEGRLLPGTQLLVSQVRMFRMQSGQNKDSDAPCDILSQRPGDLGAVFVGSGDVGLAQGAFQIPSAMSQADLQSGSPLALCFVNRQTGLTFPKGINFNQNQGSGGGPYVRLEFDQAQFLSPEVSGLRTDICHGVRLKAYTPPTVAGSQSPSWNVTSDLTAVVTSAPGQFYSNSTCETGVSQLTIASGASQSDLYYFKSSAVTSVSVGFGLSLSDSRVNFSSQYNEVQVQPATATFTLSSSTLTLGACTPLDLTLNLILFGNSISTQPLEITISPEAQNNILIYDNASCTPSASAVTRSVWSSGNSGSVYVRGTTAGTYQLPVSTTAVGTTVPFITLVVTP